MCSAEINHYKRLQKLLQEKTIDFHDLSLGNHEETLRRGISTVGIYVDLPIKAFFGLWS